MANSGDRSVSILNTALVTAAWQQEIPVTPGTVYVYGAYIAFQEISQGSWCNLQLVFLSSAGDTLEPVVHMKVHDGTRPFELDSPAQVKARAPEEAASAVVKLVMHGSGKALFDDVVFCPAPVGTILGTVATNGTPLENARVTIMGQPWRDTYAVMTDAAGHYVLDDVVSSLPRYVLKVAAPGHQTRTRGRVGVDADEETVVDIDLEPGNDPVDNLHIKFASLERALIRPLPSIPEDARVPLDETGYDPSLHVYLQADDYITSDAPAVQTLAAEILASVAEAERTHTYAVAWAVYEWVVKNTEHLYVFKQDGETLNHAVADVTAHLTWGRDFYDWAQKPTELLESRLGICVEQAWLTAALLRALNIPARSAVGNLDYWVQTPDGQGTWIGMSTAGGRTAYRDHGVLGDSFVDRPGGYYSVLSRPILQEAWNATTPGRWAETHPWSQRYDGSDSGQQLAEADLGLLALTGQSTEPVGRPQAGPNGEIHILHFSEIFLELNDMGEQRVLDVRFPMVAESATHQPLEQQAFWTNHPECVTRTRVETISNPPAVGVELWYHIELDLSSLLD